jgi:hypothetical protein
VRAPNNVRARALDFGFGSLVVWGSLFLRPGSSCVLLLVVRLVLLALPAATHSQPVSAVKMVHCGRGGEEECCSTSTSSRKASTMRKAIAAVLSSCLLFSLQAQVVHALSAQQPLSSSAAKVVAVVPSGKVAPFQDSWSGRVPDWEEVLSRVATRLPFVNPGFQMHVCSTSDMQAVRDAAHGADFLLAAHVEDEAVAEELVALSRDVPSRLCFECAPRLMEVNRLGTFEPNNPAASSAGGIVTRLSVLLGWGPWAAARAADKSLFETVKIFWDRFTSEDLIFMTLSVIDAYVAPVQAVQGLKPTPGLKTVACMCQNCSQQLLDCGSDPRCRACLDCLTKCPPNDQVCAYRCITSYESDAFAAFSLCVLQKNNCLDNRADIPVLPDPAPQSHFRGQPLTKEIAENLFIGHLSSTRPYSWKVCCGQNPAYDAFRDQHQIMYKKGRTIWYDPVFHVSTLDGQEVWRRRHYRVRHGKVPGTFYLSVSDNGVTSSEFWRIIHVADDLSWACFYYAGAASAAGQSYAGALLVTPDGSWPPDAARAEVAEAFARCNISMWELYRCQNSEERSKTAPLGVPEGCLPQVPAYT